MSDHNNPDAKPARLGPGTYEFEAMELINYPGLEATGEAYIAIDDNGDWYVEDIYLGIDRLRLLRQDDAVYIWIRQTLEIEQAEVILGLCIAWGEDN